MSEWLVGGFLAVVLASVVCLAFASDSERWDQTEDPDCWQLTHTTRLLLAQDTTTRERFCLTEADR